MSILQTLVVDLVWVAAQAPDQWLTAGERAVCDRAMSIRRRADRVAGRLAVKRLLADVFGIPPLAYEIGAEGVAPALKGWPGPSGLTISLSHSAGLGAAAWAWTESEGTVGVDVQRIRAAHPGLAVRALTEMERGQAATVPGGDGVLLFWALKEAAIKARRRPWGRTLHEIEVTLDAGEPGCARIAVFGEPTQFAHYEQRDGWWLARSVRPSASIKAGDAA